MQTFTQVRSKVMPLPVNNIDTDQIIPARYLKVTDKASVAEGLFADWRYLPDGSPNPEFVLNQPQYQGAEILLAGNNFGSGSSREHAPWALTGNGFRCVISTAFADIFKNNALKNGLLPVVIQEDEFATLRAKLEENPAAEITVDLPQQSVIVNEDTRIAFENNPFAKQCLLSGQDQLEYILSFEEEIIIYEKEMA